MHAKPDLRVFFEAMISGSGSVIVAVIQLHGRISHMRQWKLRFSVRSLLIATAIFGITIAWVVSTSLEKLPWLKSATIHEELYNDAEVERLGERFPNIVFHSSILIAE